MAKATGLVFHCSMSLQPERYLLAYRSTCNAFFSVLLCVPFIFPDSEKHWFGGCMWWLSLCNEYFSSATIIQRCFSNSSWFVLLCNKPNIADREGQSWILQFHTMAWGAQHHYIFMVATLITNVLFEQFLIYTAMKLGEYCRQRIIMHTLLLDIIKAWRIITTLWYGMHQSVNIIICKKS